MRYFHAIPSKFVCVNSTFENEFPFCVLVPLTKRQRVANIFHARCVILKMSVYSLVIAWEYGKGIRDAQSRNEKWIYFMLLNNKFLGKCWYRRHPWIRLATESERMVEKGISFIFCLGTAYDISSMESVGSSKSFSLVGKVCLPKCFYLSIFALSSGTSTNPYFPLRRAFLLLYAIFILSHHLLL